MEHLLESLSETLKRFRQERNWSLDATAQATGISKAMLGQIERCESSPTLTTLWKLAKGFEVPLSAFIDPSTDKQRRARSNPVKQKPAPDSMWVATLFSESEQIPFEWLELTFPEGYERDSEPHLNGVIEHVVVKSGQLEITVDGKRHELNEGETMRFYADKPHTYRNLASGDTVVHNLIYYPHKLNQNQKD
jgi:transcriptional regulator with XRE-family HTH domain